MGAAVAEWALAPRWVAGARWGGAGGGGARRGPRPHRRSGRVGGARVEGYANHLADAPLGIVLVMAGERPAQETYDEGRLAERVMLAALAHGVGSSVGWIVGGGRDAAREILVVPEGRMVRTAISLGYPDERAGRRRASQARKPLSEIVHEERYG